MIHDLQQITSYKQLSDKVLAFYTDSQETWDFLDEMFLKQRDTPLKNIQTIEKITPSRNQTKQKKQFWSQLLKHCCQFGNLKSQNIY